MSQFHRFPACRALAAISIVYLTCAFAPAHAAADTAAADTTAADTAAAAPDPSGTAASTPAVDEVVVIAQRLNEARTASKRKPVLRSIPSMKRRSQHSRAATINCSTR